MPMTLGHANPDDPSPIDNTKCLVQHGRHFGKRRIAGNDFGKNGVKIGEKSGERSDEKNGERQDSMNDEKTGVDGGGGPEHGSNSTYSLHWT